MSLLDVAKSIKKEGFDPRKDSANGPAPIPAGTYPVVLKDAKFNVSEKDGKASLTNLKSVAVIMMGALNTQVLGHCLNGTAKTLNGLLNVL